MKLLEYQGKELFSKYGIPVPKGIVLHPGDRTELSFPLVLKSQVPVGNRNNEGGILVVEKPEDFEAKKEQLFLKEIAGNLPPVLLAEEKIPFEQELYCSFTYDTAHRSPVLALSKAGGTGIEDATIVPLDLLWGLPAFKIRNALLKADIAADRNLVAVIQKLWNLFREERTLLAEINPLFRLQDGTYVAGDAKVVLDDNIADPDFRPFLDLPGDIAILASGGGASLINLDALLHFGGKPANYVEYSGNPPASLVADLTKKVLAKQGLKGCWVVGGTANFTDIYETLLGFAEGLWSIDPKPTYPIVIRRDGPRQEEAFAMLKEVGEKEGYDFHLYGPETSMSESARIMVELAYGNSR